MTNQERKVIKNLALLPIEEKEQFFDSFDMIQTDCDGVLWMLRDPYPGVGLAIRTLRNNGKRVVYVSNNSVRTMADYRGKLEQLTEGALDERDIIHPAKVIIEFLQWRKFEGLCYVIGSSNFKSCLREAGFQVLDGPNEPVTESIAVVAPIISDKQPVKAVIVDFDYNCNNIKLLRAQLYLQSNPDCWFIAGAMDKILPVGPAMRLIGPGCFVDVLSQSTGRKPYILGKPGYEMSQVMKRLQPVENPRRVLFVGDQPELDMKFGSVSGFQTLLVGTGGVTPDTLEDAGRDVETVPDYYIPAFADLEQLVLDVLAYKAKVNKSAAL
ncbi:uncharacterized protein LOC125955054 [Anopheles darlingi]|uniref:uncharacterized protein LOC125955054 n=1 Tax=Anopheles darlingi TaxID=43151 RepID=UPI0020FFF7AA|nr:uncharacterized protein LOC125955054 [Anopheles darlingi]